MKKVILLVALFVGFSGLSQEKRTEKREPRSSEERVENQVERLKKDLSLNEKQVQEVKTLLTKQFEKREAKKTEMKALREEKTQKIKASKEEREARKEEMQKEQEQHKADMKKILTAEQYTKWEQTFEERKEKMIEKINERKRRP